MISAISVPTILYEAVKVLGYGLRRPGFDFQRWKREKFSSLLRVQISPGARTPSYKLSTGTFPEVKTVERRTRHLTTS